MEIESMTLNKIAVIEGDITKQKVDAIVNAANEALMPGGGVCGAIFRAAGAGLLDECMKLKHCDTGDAKITKGYKLPAKWIIHTVGPVWEGGKYGEDELLASCYRRCLEVAEQYSIGTIAFPAISTGIYGFPMERASGIAIPQIKSFLENNTSIEQVILICFGQQAYNCFLSAMQENNQA
jgi:O-acetyl-ADP-ribose deacetylase